MNDLYKGQDFVWIYRLILKDCDKGSSIRNNQVNSTYKDVGLSSSNLSS